MAEVPVKDSNWIALCHFGNRAKGLGNEPGLFEIDYAAGVMGQEVLADLHSQGGLTRALDVSQGPFFPVGKGRVPPLPPDQGSESSCDHVTLDLGGWRVRQFGNSPLVNFTRSSIAYVDTLGNLIANNWNDLASGTIRSPINRTSSGAYTSDYPVWTFTNTNGTATNHQQTDTCLGISWQ
ncbi:MAG TPA: hypothetical protein VFG53_04590 [Anaeromyxobacter sp.]|nr:hypothetical protein [Anaeromyxobacter sp.]